MNASSESHSKEFLTTLERYQQGPSRSLSSRARFWFHYAPGLTRLAMALGTFAAAFAIGFLPAMLLLIAGHWFRSAAETPYRALLSESPEESEKLALEFAKKEEPGPLSDAYLTAAATAKAMAGDKAGAKDLLAQRESPVTELKLLDPWFLPLAATAFHSIGEASEAMDLMGPLDPESDSIDRLLFGASLSIASRRFRSSLAILQGLLKRTSSPVRRRHIHGLFVLLARESWDPELPELLKRLHPETSEEHEISLLSRTYLAEISAQPEQALGLLEKLWAHRYSVRKLDPSEKFLDWKKELHSTRLFVSRFENKQLDAILRGLEAKTKNFKKTDVVDIEDEYSKCWLEIHHALLSETPEALNKIAISKSAWMYEGGILWASRILVEASLLNDFDLAQRTLLKARSVAGESPAVMAAAAVLRLWKNQEVGEEGQFALTKARMALELFPPRIAKMLQDLPSSPS